MSAGGRIYVEDGNENNAVAALYLGEYHPYWHCKELGEKNPQFDEWSRQILNIKKNYDAAVNFFFPKLDALLCQGIAIAVVPGHEPIPTGQPPSGLVRLVGRLAVNGRVDASSCLVRTQAIPKLATGGNRSVGQHLRTIALANAHLVRGRPVLLLDDVTTTTNSLTACQQILAAGGAAKVKCLALGRTTRGSARA
jgi:hypothetical protein